MVKAKIKIKAIFIRSSFLNAAHEVLEHYNRPMTAREIVFLGIQDGHLRTHGETPHKTMNARLSEDILHKKSTSDFMRVDSGVYGLRKWDQNHQEYIANRRTIALFDEDILVFEKKLLRDFMPTDGLSSNNIDHQKLISSCFAMKRRAAEEDFDVIQLVSLYVVTYGNRYFTYKRTKRLPESRLHDYYSVCFGGHLNPDDLMPLFRFADHHQALHLIDRELNEELRLGAKPKSFKFIGLLYDPRSEVSKQHIGLSFIVDASISDVSIGERGFLTSLKLETKDEILARSDDFENWSEYLINSGRI